MKIELKPIGVVSTDAETVPRHWSISDVEGELIIDAKYAKGLNNIEEEQQIVVLFHFHKSEAFMPEHLLQTPPHKKSPQGVFSICSPVRPNPIGMSVLKVIEIRDNIIRVKGLDMLNGTPILDIKPHFERN